MAPDTPPATSHAKFARDLLGMIGPKAVSDIVAASGDVAMVIDSGGVIRDVALSNVDLANQGFDSVLDRRWADTVTSDSRQKVEELLRDASIGAAGRWREINHPLRAGGSLPLRYITVNAGDDGRVIAIGRDHRAVADLQQRLVQAQQAIERDFARLRETESRYRLLFQQSTEAVLIIDGATRKIVEANAAATRLLGGAKPPLAGRFFSSLFDAVSHEATTALLANARSGDDAVGRTALSVRGQTLSASASVFRQERSTMYLVRLAGEGEAVSPIPEGAQRLLDVMERMPDAFVVADDNLRIVAWNHAFLELTAAAGEAQVRGRSMHDFLGRPEIDRNILFSSVREHEVTRNFSTVLRTTLGGLEDVEVSAVYVGHAPRPCYGFSVRVSPRDAVAQSRLAGALPHSIEQLSQLVGRVTLKELVRETTDLVERLCIEAALELTNNNRASAAELLGLSRQSLYSKLHRYGLTDSADSDATD